MLISASEIFNNFVCELIIALNLIVIYCIIFCFCGQLFYCFKGTNEFVGPETIKLFSEIVPVGPETINCLVCAVPVGLEAIKLLNVIVPVGPETIILFSLYYTCGP